MERQQIVRAASNSPALPGVALPLQENLFSQVSGVHSQSPSASESNLSGEGSRAGIQVSAHGQDGIVLGCDGRETPEKVACRGAAELITQSPRILPDVCRSRHGGNPQSEEANKRVHPSKSELKTKILNFIRERVGSTTEEVATGLNLRYTTASGRISELRRDSALEDSGKTRPTSSGCAATVWTTKGTTK